MQLSIAAVGRKDRFDDEVESYLGRARALGKPLGLKGPDLTAVDAPRSMTGAVRQAREAELLQDALPQGARIVLLDEGGKDLSSRALANLIAKERDGGAKALSFLIGGADGFGADFVGSLGGRRAGTLAFGRATWPHMMVRLMLAEQLYRSTTILSGHPYHRD